MVLDVALCLAICQMRQHICKDLNLIHFFHSCFLSVYTFTASHNEISRYSSEEISGNESNEVTSMTESERQAEINRQKEEMKIKRRKKKRTSSSMQSSTFKGNNSFLLLFYRRAFSHFALGSLLSY